MNGDMEKVSPECGKKITSTGPDFTPPGSLDFLIHLFFCERDAKVGLEKYSSHMACWCPKMMKQRT